MKNKKYRIITIIGFLIGIGILSEIDEDFIPIVLIIAIVWFVYRKFSKRNKKDVVPGLSKEKQEHYYEAGMSDKEIEFFRNTLAEAKEQINQLEQNFKAVPKLKAINLRYDTLKVSQAMFKELVKEPKKLHLADKFLYNHLPNVVELTNKYVEISDHEIKSKATYDTLNESIVAIEDVAQLIIKDYENFVSDDIEDLEVEISIAKQNANRDKQKTDVSEDQEEN
ncbi:5-bromo-4-chloroindolyl phosphate hydrolysis family protein [Vagococcus teuberi]